MKKPPKVTERGWAGHFICADRCLFRRNTLIESENDSVIVSTVGAMRKLNGGSGIETIGASGRYYETMAFGAQMENGYVDINVSDQRAFDSKWQISADSEKKLRADVDNEANDMHEGVVAEFVALLRRGRASRNRGQT